MYQKVLIPLDGSPFAERVLSHIEWLTSPQAAEIILLHVVRPPTYVVGPEAMAPLEPIDATYAEKDAEAYLKQVKGELREMGLQAHTQIGDGDVASTICGVADAQDADLIAMTTHGRSGVSRWAFGSVADRVIRSAPQPIFLVRGTDDVAPRKTIRKIMVPLDGSELAEQALPQAEVLAKEKGAEVLLLRAIEPLSDREFAALFAAWESPEEVYAHRQTAAEQYLEQIQGELRATILSSEILVEEGHPAEVILDTAGAEAVDLIVMSTHGRSGLSRWVYGSIADKVLHKATCPLLLIRARPAGRGQ